MVFVGIKKENGIDGIIDSFTQKQLEQTYEVNEDNKLKTLLTRFEKNLTQEDLSTCEPSSEILTPKEIDTFLQSTKIFEERDYYEILLIPTLNKLIQTSYQNKHNSFILNMGFNYIILEELCSNLRGEKTNSLQITINGYVGERFGENSRYLFAKGEFAEDNLGHSSEHSSFTFDKAGQNCGHSSKYSHFEINEVDALLGEKSNSSTFVIHNSWEGFGAYNFTDYDVRQCTFKTPNREVLRKFMALIPEGNKIIFINGAKEEVVRNYDQSRN